MSRWPVGHFGEEKLLSNNRCEKGDCWTLHMPGTVVVALPPPTRAPLAVEALCGRRFARLGWTTKVPRRVARRQPTLEYVTDAGGNSLGPRVTFLETAMSV
ncbi:hypothetical protein MRX96_009786 [Rhipicephalus microplus]